MKEWYTYPSETLWMTLNNLSTVSKADEDNEECDADEDEEDEVHAADEDEEDGVCADDEDDKGDGVYENMSTLLSNDI